MNAVIDTILYFFLYSIVGWVVETIYCSVGEKKFVNRGFLTGPMCPIYGTGATVFSVCLSPFYEKFGYSRWYIIVLVIFLGMLLADIVEFLTSVIMEKLFNARWWDYSKKKFNIQGRICLGHTIYWGIATGLFVYLVHPFVVGQVESLVNPMQRRQIVVMLLIVFVFDLFFAVKGAFDVRKLMTKLNKLYDSAHETVTAFRSNVSQKYEDIHDTMEKGVYKLAVWVADVSRQISELEKLPAPKKRKNGKNRRVRSSAERQMQSAKTLRQTMDAKIQSLKDMLEEVSRQSADEEEKK